MKHLSTVLSRVCRKKWDRLGSAVKDALRMYPSMIEQIETSAISDGVSA